MPVPKRIRKALPLLTEQVAKTAVQVAVERMKRGSFRGLDGVPVQVYAAFPDIFVTSMTMAVKKCLAARESPADWLISLQRNIPKSQNADIVDQMRPIALQTMLWKWIATTILVVVEDAQQVAVPLAQKGSLKHTQMLHHVINTRFLWESTEDSTFLSVDFAKAYGSVSHAFFEA